MALMMPTVDRRTLFGVALALFTLGAAAVPTAAAEPLASWNEGAAKARIVSFVREVSERLLGLVEGDDGLRLLDTAQPTCKR